MKLTDLDPQWIDEGERRGIGVSFRCMVAGHCSGRQWILFANPLDGGPAWEGNCLTLMFAKRDRGEVFDAHDRPCGFTRWRREGEAFESMTLAPSVDAHECGHLTLTNGTFS